MHSSLGGEVVHAIPGRVRLRIEGLKGDAVAAQRLERDLASLPGVRRSKASIATGTLLLEYDPHIMPPSNFGDVRKRRTTFPPLDAGRKRETSSSTSHIANRVTDAFENIDRGISRATHGLLNLRTAIPLTLLTMAVRRIIIDGDMEAVPVHALLWYGYSTFHNMHLQLQMKERFSETEGSAR